MLILIEADVVENEELGFGPEIRGVADAAVLQIHLGFARDPARIAIVALPRDRVDHVAGHHQRRNLIEGIGERGARIRDQQHVAFVDGGPAPDAGSVHPKAFLERIFGKLGDRVGHVMLQAGNVAEPQIELLQSILLGVLEDFWRGHGSS